MNIRELGLYLFPIVIALAIFVSVFLLISVFSKQIQDLINIFIGKQHKKLEQQFELLHLPFTPQQYLLFQGAVALSLFVVGILSGPNISVQLASGILFAWAGIWLTRRYIDDQHKKRLETFKAQFADAIALIGNSVRSGLSLFQALEMVVKEMDDPMAYEVKQVLQATRVGQPLDSVLEDWARRINSVDLDIFVTAVNIQRQTGGDLGVVLQTLGNTIRQRVKIQGQIQSLTAQGRLSAYILSGLPIFMGVALYFLNPNRMSLMFTHPIGWGMLAISFVTIALGILVVRKLVDIDI